MEDSVSGLVSVHVHLDLLGDDVKREVRWYCIQLKKPVRAGKTEAISDHIERTIENDNGWHCQTLSRKPLGYILFVVYLYKYT